MPDVPRPPLNGNDARAILGITWQWIEDVNNGLGYDTDDLISALKGSGYGPEWTEGA